MRKFQILHDLNDHVHCNGTFIYLLLLRSIELQVQEQPAEVRSAVYSHLEAFVPCNKEALLKRLKKLSLNIQVGELLS